MVDAGALLAWGMPPAGLGVFARDDVEEGPWRHVAVNFTRTDRVEQARAARARGADVWGFAGPSRMAPSTWRDGIARFRATRDEIGAVGLVAEYEDAWPFAGDDERRAYGAALRELALETRVVVTYFPDIGGLEVLADACGLGVVGMVQMHGLSSTSPATFARWWARSVNAWGLRLLLAIAGWTSSGLIDTVDEYRAYLAALPRCGGAWVWPLAGTRIPSWMLAALRDYEPGGSALGTALEATLRTVVRPAFALIVGLLVLLVAFVSLAWRELRRA